MQLDLCRFAIAAAVVVTSAGAALSSTVSVRFAASGPGGHAAAANFTFDDVSNTVTVELRNTIGAAHKGLESRALTGLFWDLNSSGAFSHSSVAAEAGAKVGTGSNTPAQLWAFRGSMGASGTHFGLGTLGLGEIFTPAHLLAPALVTKAGQLSNVPTGLEGGVLSSTGNVYGPSKTPMWREFVRFTFAVDPALFQAGLNDLDVKNVRFQFGASLNEPALWDMQGVRSESIPLPSAAALGAAGLLTIAAPRRRRSGRGQ